ncbi:hypothetical protein TKK_0011457 [Trichogramma kaykai]
MQINAQQTIKSCQKVKLLESVPKFSLKNNWSKENLQPKVVIEKLNHQSISFSQPITHRNSSLSSISSLENYEKPDSESDESLLSENGKVSLSDNNESISTDNDEPPLNTPWKKKYDQLKNVRSVNDILKDIENGAESRKISNEHNSVAINKEFQNEEFVPLEIQSEPNLSDNAANVHSKNVVLQNINVALNPIRTRNIKDIVSSIRTKPIESSDDEDLLNGAEFQPDNVEVSTTDDINATNEVSNSSVLKQMNNQNYHCNYDKVPLISDHENDDNGDGRNNNNNDDRNDDDDPFTSAFPYIDGPENWIPISSPELITRASKLMFKIHMAYAKRRYNQMMDLGIMGPRLPVEGPHSQYEVLENNMFHLGCGITCGFDTWKDIIKGTFRMFCRSLITIMYKDQMKNMCLDFARTHVSLPGYDAKLLISPRKFNLYLEICQDFLDIRDIYKDMTKTQKDTLMLTAAKAITSASSDKTTRHKKIVNKLNRKQTKKLNRKQVKKLKRIQENKEN